MQFDRQFLTKTLSNVSIEQDYFPEDILFSIDTRTLNAEDIFIAMVGHKNDGHDFLKDAFLKGASGCIINRSKLSLLKKIDKNLLHEKLVVLVDDTHEALLMLASAWRKQFSCPVIGITGSVGKTSTKECLSYVLDQYGMHHIASIDNQNTLIGSALNMLRLREHHKVAIFEMGISNRGEMALIADLVRPTIGVITNIGHQHMDGLGSLHDIAIEKRDIFKYFAEDNIGIINGDQAILSDVSYLHPIIKFGSKMSNQIQARKTRISGEQIHFILKIYGKKYPVIIKKPHVGIINQVLAVSAVGYLLQIPDEVMVKAIQEPMVVAGRFQPFSCKFNGATLIDDCYNANPESVKAALLALQQMESTQQKIVVLGDMLGLGINSPFWHRQIGRFLRKVPSVKKVILVGKLVEWVQKTAPFGCEVVVVADWQSAVAVLEQDIKNKPVILVKGSRAIGLDNLVKQFAV
ncbi:UDP-N-acetylmuramoyl-tripeptide--D-alanyl-D-alanine ligase [Candidatus Dependentiae bacterium]|nr:MAG: UDP-N-acetylmuramoyl-tripeptide--D-alanyl-D-alanine ligase [Candidatus Dependentiae bacterium]